MKATETSTPAAVSRQNTNKNGDSTTMAEQEPRHIKAIQILMPSAGDMRMVKQDDSSITLQPIYYGEICVGPHLHIVTVDSGTGKVVSVDKRMALRLRKNGRIELKEGSPYEGEPSGS